MIAYTKVFLASLDSMETVLAWFLHHAKKHIHDKQQQYKLELALEELIVNIMEHAYQKKNLPIFFKLIENHQKMSAEIRDIGSEFDIVSHEIMHPMQQDRQVALGGHGLRFVKAALKNIQYSYQNGMNVIRFEM